MVIPKANSHSVEFKAAVAEVERMLKPEVVRLRYSFEDDWSGEPSVFFKITLSDEAAYVPGRQLAKTTYDISTVIEQRIEPLEQWGVRPYYNVRSQSEQAVIQDEAWA